MSNHVVEPRQIPATLVPQLLHEAGEVLADRRHIVVLAFRAAGARR